MNALIESEGIVSICFVSEFKLSMTENWGILRMNYAVASSVQMNWIVRAWIWYSGILRWWTILIKTVFSCLDVYWDYHGIFLEFFYCILSWSRGHFHVSIKRVFSTGSDLNMTSIWSSLAYCDCFHLLSYEHKGGIELDLYLVKCVSKGMIFDNGLSHGIVLGFSVIASSYELTFEITCFDWVLIWLYFMEIRTDDG